MGVLDILGFGYRLVFGASGSGVDLFDFFAFYFFGFVWLFFISYFVSLFMNASKISNDDE